MVVLAFTTLWQSLSIMVLGSVGGGVMMGIVCAMSGVAPLDVCGPSAQLVSDVAVARLNRPVPLDVREGTSRAVKERAVEGMCNCIG